MANFTDMAGRKWDIVMTVGALKRIRAQLPEFDIMDALTGKTAIKLIEHPELFADILVAMLQPQLDKNGVDVEHFVEALGGDALGAATDAFFESVLDFFPNAAWRDALKTRLKTVSPVIQKRFSDAISNLNERETQEQIDRFVAKIFGA